MKQSEIKKIAEMVADIVVARLQGDRPDKLWSEAADKHIKESTKKSLGDDIAQIAILEPYIGDVPIRLINRDHPEVINWIRDRYDEGVSPRTVNKGLELIRSVLNKCAKEWRENGITWLAESPFIKMEEHKNPKIPFPLTMKEQDLFFANLPSYLRQMALFKVNTGVREANVCGLKWEWEEYNEELGETIFRIPGKYTKNGKDHEVVLNSIARKVIEEQRQNKYSEFVFELSLKKMNSKAWCDAWKEARLPNDKRFLKGPHNLKHTFGKRLRDAGVDERDVKDLLHHKPKGVTRRYSAPELKNLRACVERIVP